MNSLRATLARVPRVLRYALPVLGIIFVLSSLIQAQNVVYAATNTSGFGTLDLDSGRFTQLGTSQTQLAGLGELGANLYGGVAGHGAFDQVSLSNGSLTTLGNYGVTFRAFGATSGHLYSIAVDGELGIWKVGLGVSNIGATGLGTGTLAMSADGAQLYAALDPGTGSSLYVVNTSTGAATLIGATGVPNITALVYRHGVLYAATASEDICTLNLQTGQASCNVTTSVVAVGMAMPATTFAVLHTFTGPDGATPEAGLIRDRAGNLYGTTDNGGASNGVGNGTVFKMTKHTGGWVLSSLFKFNGADGANPLAPVTIGPDGALYGTTSYGLNDEGGIFRLQPPAAFCKSVDCGWGETNIYVSHRGTTPGAFAYGALIFDAAGNMYGTANEGGTGSNEAGVVFEMTPAGGGNWTMNILYSFGSGPGDGMVPYSGVVFDNAGNLYGTTNNGGTDNVGTVYELTKSGGSWTEIILHNFLTSGGDGYYSTAGLLFDGVNTLYGPTPRGGSNNFGVVYDLVNSNGSWNYNLLFSFPGGGTDEYGPAGPLTRDASGNLYGATTGNGEGYGNVFELTPSANGWTYTDLYEFNRQSDGAYPNGGLVFDTAGNLYGTTSCGSGCPGGNDGTVYELTLQ